jgi:hypothetical protein
MQKQTFRGTSYAMAVLLIVGVLAGLPPMADAQKDFLPAELQDLDLGLGIQSLLERVGKSGLYAQTPVPRSQRTVVTWFPEDSPYYQKVEFWFSEKGRLYMARFGLKDDSRWSSSSVKKQFLEKYLGSWLDPKRFRMEPNDMIVYIPQDPSKAQVLEVTNIHSGEKFFELFDSRIDAEDSLQSKPNKGAVTTSKAVGAVPKQEKR